MIAVGTGFDGRDTAARFAEAGFLFFKSRVAGLHGEDVSKEIFGRGVFVEAANEVGDGGVEVFLFYDGGVEEDGTAFSAEGASVFVCHAFEHFEFDTILNAVFFSEKEGIGDVEEVMGGDTDSDGRGVFWLHGEVEETLKVSIDVSFIGIGSLGPVVLAGFDFFHGEVGSFDDTDFDFGFAGFGPSSELLEGGEGIGKVGLEYDACLSFCKFGFVEGALKGLAGEVEISVFLHVEVDEFPAAVEWAEALLDRGEGACLVEEIDLREDGRDFYGEVLALGLCEEGEILLKAFFGFFFSEDGFSEEVEVYFGALGKMGAEGFLFTGEDDALAVFTNLRSDGRHDEGGKEVGGEGSDLHE